MAQFTSDTFDASARIPRSRIRADEDHATEPSDSSLKTLLAAVTAVLRSSLPAQPTVSRSTIAVLLGSPRRELRGLPLPILAAYTAAVVWSLIRSGQASQAARLVDREGLELLKSGAVSAPPATESVCYSVMASAYLLTGRCSEGAYSAQIARDYAAEADDDACRFLALGLSAASLAVSGEFSTAAGLLGSARELGAAHGWGSGAWPLVLASVLIDYRRGDADGIQAALESLGGNGTRDVVDRAVLTIGGIWLHGARADYREMAAAARSATHGVGRRLFPPFFADLAASLECLALEQLGDPVSALKVIAGRPSPQGHSVCFELHRATIHLQLGEPKEALRATETCVSSCPNHNLRSLPSVLLRRAVAYELMGRSSSADAEFSRASHLAARLGGVAPTVGLRLGIMKALYTRLLVNEPALGEAIAERLLSTGSYPDPDPLSHVRVRLTGREAVLAEWLTTGMTFNEISEHLHVSVNTLKTQARSLYSKFGVSSRDDVVAIMERDGLFRNIQLDPQPCGSAKALKPRDGAGGPRS